MTLVSLLCVALSIAPAPAAAQENADSVIDAAVAALGGGERMAAIHSLVLRGFHYEGAYHQEYAASRAGTATMARMRPNRRIVGCRPEVPGCSAWGRIVEGYDGENAWELNWPRQRLVHAVNKAERALRCGAEFDPLFVDYKARGFSARFEGLQTLLGQTAQAVTIVHRGCPDETFYFDPATHLPLMHRIALPLHARGDAVDTVQVYKEFVSVQGVRIPSRSEDIALPDGRVLGGGVWTQIVPNVVDDPQVFAAPAVQPAGATKLALEMLDAAARESPTRLLQRYDAFLKKPAGAAADTQYDMNWLGYELLKVDAYPAAIAVLRRVAEEHPDSADAHESLGDAYAQQGDRKHALVEYERARTLDAKRDEVVRKLRELRELRASR